MNPNTIIITRPLDKREVERLQAAARELWPGQSFTIHHGQMLRDVDELQAAVGPGEFKDATMTPVPRWAQSSEQGRWEPRAEPPVATLCHRCGQELEGDCWRCDCGCTAVSPLGAP